MQVSPASAVPKTMNGDTRVYQDPPVCIDTGDQASVKQTLDEALMQAVGDVGFVEDMRQQNAKLALMVFALLAGAVGQFYEKYDTAWTFPVNVVMLFICCSLYFTVSGALEYVLRHRETTVIAFYRPFDAAKNHAGMAVHTDGETHTDQYQIALVERDGRGACLSKHYGVGEFFDIDGNLDEEAFDAVAKQLLLRYNNGERDDEPAALAPRADFFPYAPKAKSC
ncbi:signal peptidase complex subunit 2 [bacterium]|nr:signal peptidase complex subunit 2 [bacterium]